MRNLLLIFLFAPILSGCSTTELLTVAEKEHIEARRLYDAETLCMDYKIFSHTKEYDACIENILGLNNKPQAKEAMRAMGPSELSTNTVADSISKNTATSAFSNNAAENSLSNEIIISLPDTTSEKPIIDQLDQINTLPNTSSGYPITVNTANVNLPKLSTTTFTECICTYYGYSPDTQEHTVCLEYAANHPIRPGACW